MDTLMRNGWFLRLWVLQEAVLPRSNRCILGPEFFALEDIFSLCWRTIDHGHWIDWKVWLGNHRSPKAIAGVDGAQSIDALRKGYGWIHKDGDGTANDLAQLLSFNVDRAATVQHDRVYSVMGLLASQIDGKPLPDALKVNYQIKSLRDAYRDATRHAIDSRKDFFVLGEVRHRSEGELQLDAFPSWVSRWDLMAKDEDGPTSLGWWQKAHLRVRPIAPPGSDTDVLQWYGIKLDEVSQTSPVFTEEILQDSKKLHSMFELVENLYQPQDENSLAQTLICGMFHMRDATSHDVKGMKPLAKRLSNGGSLNNIPPPQQKYYSAMLSASRRRRFFITGQWYVGMRPSATRAGDIAVILNRGTWPLILRADGSHQLLGAAYVYGVMKREAAKEHIDSGRKHILFKIR